VNNWTIDGCGIEPLAANKLEQLCAQDPNLRKFVTATIEELKKDIHLIVSSDTEWQPKIQSIAVDDVS
jgi:hypothetical protein